MKKFFISLVFFTTVFFCNIQNSIAKDPSIKTLGSDKKNNEYNDEYEVKQKKIIEEYQKQSEIISKEIESLENSLEFDKMYNDVDITEKEAKIKELKQKIENYRSEMYKEITKIKNDFK